jgi:hypothetical protein
MTDRLPPLPAMPFVQLEDTLIAWAKEYGQQCRDAALEEAAQRVAKCQGPRSSTEAAVKGLI